MSIKKEYTIEELAKACEEAKQHFERLNTQLEQQKKKEEEEKKAFLAKAKASRKKEVDEAVSKAIDLVRAWTDDFGIYSYKSDDDNSIFSSKFWNWIW